MPHGRRAGMLMQRVRLVVHGDIKRLAHVTGCRNTCAYLDCEIFNRRPVWGWSPALDLMAGPLREIHESRVWQHHLTAHEISWILNGQWRYRP